MTDTVRALGDTMSTLTSSDYSTRAYMKWDTPGVEEVPEGEMDDIKAVGDMINHSQAAMYNKHRHCFGGTHARTQSVVKGEMIIPDDLPVHLRQSLWATPGSHPVIMRYSSEPGDPSLDDRLPQPRGLGMKVFNVEGEFYEPGKDLHTQDIEFNSTPVLDLADAKTTKEIIELRIKYGQDQPQLYKQLEKRNDTTLQKARDMAPNMHLENTPFYSQSAYRFGDYVAKYRLTPSSETKKKLSDAVVKAESDPDNILSNWMREFFAKNDAEYLFQMQLLENLEAQPVEYVGAQWSEMRFPFQTVARVVIPKQDSFMPARVTFWQDHMRLDPWHGLKSFQPLGSSNRLRKTVYQMSSELRRRMNARKVINITSVDELPDGDFVDG